MHSTAAGWFNPIGVSEDGAGRSGYSAHPGPHQADLVDLGLLARAVLGADASLIAFVEQFDFLQFVESVSEGGARIFGRQATDILALNDKPFGQSPAAFP